MTRKEAKQICNKHSLSITSRGVFEYVRIDRIDWNGMPKYKKYHIKTDDADWAVMWFTHDKPFHDCDGCDHYPEKLLVTSTLLNISHTFTRDEVQKIFDKYVFENIPILQQIISNIFDE